MQTDFEHEDINAVLPGNVKQMGAPDDELRIYMEDYVHTYLYQYSRSSVNGEKLAETYLPQQGLTEAKTQQSYQVPEGCLFFLGDNRTGSYDARSWDDPYVPVSNVRSHVMVCISFLKDNSWRGIRAVS